jgi:4'-phosphopantetheinyl transferase
MLVFNRQPMPGVQLAVWQVLESEAHYRDGLHWGTAELAELAAHQAPQRRLEWLASRWLLHRLTGTDTRLELQKNGDLRPFFAERPDWHCSLSHTHGYVAALLSTESVAGCDLQLIVPKISRIAHKFMRDDERAVLEAHPLEQHLLIQHLYWSAKEALYKAYSRREVDFRAHLYIESFEWEPTGMSLRGWLRKPQEELAYRVFLGQTFTPDAPEGLVWAVAVAD